MKRTIVLIGVLLSMWIGTGSAIAAELVYSIPLQYFENSFKLDGSVALIAGSAPDYINLPEESFTARVTAQDEVLHEFHFFVTDERTYSARTDEDTAPLPPNAPTYYTLVAPYFPSATAISILKTGNHLLTIDVSPFMSSTNADETPTIENTVPTNSETFPTEIPTFPAATDETPETKTGIPSAYILIGFILLGIGIVIAIVVILKQRKRKSTMKITFVNPK